MSLVCYQCLLEYDQVNHMLFCFTQRWLQKSRRVKDKARHQSNLDH